MLKLSVQMVFLGFMEPHVSKIYRPTIRAVRRGIAEKIFMETGYDWFHRDDM